MDINDINSKDWDGIAKFTGLYRRELEAKLGIKIPFADPKDSAEARRQYTFLLQDRQPTEQIEAALEKIGLDEIEKATTTQMVLWTLKHNHNIEVYITGCDKFLSLTKNPVELIDLFFKYRNFYSNNIDAFKRFLNALSASINTFNDFIEASKKFTSDDDNYHEPATNKVKFVIVLFGAQLATTISEINLVNEFNEFDVQGEAVIDGTWAKITMADLKKAKTARQVDLVYQERSYRLSEIATPIIEKHTRLNLRAANRAVSFKGLLKICKRFKESGDARNMAIQRLWSFTNILEEFKEFAEWLKNDKDQYIVGLVDQSNIEWDKSSWYLYNESNTLDQYLTVFKQSREGSNAKTSSLEKIIELYPKKVI